MTSETVASEITIAGAPERILDTLCDFEAYPRWARSMKAARVLDRGADGRGAKVEFQVAPGLLPEVRYVLRYSYRPDGLEWDYVEGDLKDIRGSYTLEAAGDRTKVVYQLSIDPGDLLLPGFWKARAAREITRVALRELKRRVETS